MNRYKLFSPTTQYSASDNQWWLCPKSNLALDVEYQDKSILLPLSQLPVVSLGEGNTPLLKLKNLSQELGMQLWAKCEFLNPTGSFKDRGSAVEVSKALELGTTGVVCASTGNMAASLSAYAAKTALQCIVVVPAQTPETKLRQALICGAKLKKVAGNYDECVAVAQEIAQKQRYFLCGDYVVRREGQKSIGWELAQSGLEIDAIVVPVGNGTVGVAVMKGFFEKALNKRLPLFIGIQGEHSNPIEKAWRVGKKIKALAKTQTIASAFDVGNPLDGWLVLDWLEKSKGVMNVASDEEIRQAQKLLAEEEGLYVETASAATLIGVLKNREALQGQTVVLILTGSGLKEDISGNRDPIRVF